MIRRIGKYLLYIGALFSINPISINYAANAKPSVRIEYELPPNQPMLFANFWFTKITAVCVTQTKDDDDSAAIYAELIVKKGQINGIDLSQGETLSMMVRDEERLIISADSGAKVRITNLSESSVKAYCYNG